MDTTWVAIAIAVWLALFSGLWWPLVGISAIVLVSAICTAFLKWRDG